MVAFDSPTNVLHSDLNLKTIYNFKNWTGWGENKQFGLKYAPPQIWPPPQISTKYFSLRPHLFIPIFFKIDSYEHSTVLPSIKHLSCKRKM